MSVWFKTLRADRNGLDLNFDRDQILWVKSGWSKLLPTDPLIRLLLFYVPKHLLPYQNKMIWKKSEVLRDMKVARK